MTERTAAAMDPQVIALLEKLSALNLPAVAGLSPEAAREQMEASVRARQALPTTVGAIESLTIPGPGGDIPCRLYRPEGAGSDPLPVVVFYHGGGHVIGSLDTHDATARSLCAGGNCLLVSVDYRMGPEHYFPAAVDDSYAALEWVAANAASIGGDAGRIAVAGDSAGGNLATVVALMARDAGGPKLVYQVLVYPLTDYRCDPDSGSYKLYGKGHGILEADTMIWFQQHYMGPDGDTSDWRASPLLAKDLSGLPPAYVITAECDVLRDEGIAYVERLRAARVEVTYRDCKGMIHAFFGMTGVLDGADEAHVHCGAALRAALHG